MLNAQTITAILSGGPMDGLTYDDYVGLLSIVHTSRVTGLRHIYELVGVVDGVALYVHVGVSEG